VHSFWKTCTLVQGAFETSRYGTAMLIFGAFVLLKRYGENANESEQTG